MVYDLNPKNLHINGIFLQNLLNNPIFAFWIAFGHYPQNENVFTY